jgi:hypothetical protein
VPCGSVVRRHQRRYPTAALLVEGIIERSEQKLPPEPARSCARYVHQDVSVAPALVHHAAKELSISEIPQYIVLRPWDAFES